MPQCSVCGCELPGLDTLCANCYNAKYADVGNPKPFLEGIRRSVSRESIRRFVSNPMGITPEDIRDESKIPLPVVIAFCCGGLLFCWFGAFDRFDYKYSMVSEEVFSEAFLILGMSAALSLSLARKDLRVCWRSASFLFCRISASFWLWFSLDAISAR
jgi:hypothetical protein